MERIALVARLKDGSGPRAAELIAGGPPFDLAETLVYAARDAEQNGAVVLAQILRRGRRS